MFKSILRVGVATCLLWLQAAPASAVTGPHFAQGQGQLKKLDYDQALGSFQRALKWPGNTAGDLARIHLHIGIVQSSLGKHGEGGDSFKRALAKDPAVALPALTSPKIRALFEKVRLESKAAQPDKPTTPDRSTTDRLLPTDTDGDTDRPADRPTGSTNWPAWTAAGAAVALCGAGVAFGVLNRSERSDAQDKSIPYSAAQEHADRASTYGLTANILFGVAGAAAITAGVLFYFGRDKGKADGPEDMAILPAVVPVRSGALLQLEVRR